MTGSTITVGGADVLVTERGKGRPVLLLHGGGGPLTVEPWAERMADARDALVLTPTHPGFGGTPRPESLSSIAGLAHLYLDLLDALDLDDVTVIGNSIGGWIAAEMAVRGSARISSVALVDAVGIEVPGHPVADFFSLSPGEVAELSYNDPVTYGIDPAKLPPEARQIMATNRAALLAYGGASMTDPSLAARLGGITIPTLVVWGEADRIGDPDFGRAFAASIPGARFSLIEGSGHLPQIETPDELLAVVWEFSEAHATH